MDRITTRPPSCYSHDLGPTQRSARSLRKREATLPCEFQIPSDRQAISADNEIQIERYVVLQLQVAGLTPTGGAEQRHPAQSSADLQPVVLRRKVTTGFLLQLEY